MQPLIHRRDEPTNNHPHRSLSLPTFLYRETHPRSPTRLDLELAWHAFAATRRGTSRRESDVSDGTYDLPFDDGGLDLARGSNRGSDDIAASGPCRVCLHGCSASLDARAKSSGRVNMRADLSSGEVGICRPEA